jgi:hypothetical protein
MYANIKVQDIPDDVCAKIKIQTVLCLIPSPF